MKKIDSFGISDIGLRENNEDAWLHMSRESCFILTDGMGGHQAGEVASLQTINHLSSFLKSLLSQEKKYTPSNLKKLLYTAIIETNNYVYSLSMQDTDLQGMGTTLCLALIYDSSLIYAHVGDSRIYRIKNEKIERLTRDHSLKDEFPLRGDMRKNSIPLKNAITRAIGTSPHVTPEVKTTTLHPDEIYLLCSDGLTDALTDEQILKIILHTSNFQEAAKALVHLAKLAGSTDNITIILFKAYT
ncbi:MAG: protein phosphatase 2C domain-containing protein [Chlamydiae bacterium]|nr:protein phosphatase 2C domain-containing protein [Chlamydiota bacterium]